MAPESDASLTPDQEKASQIISPQSFFVISALALYWAWLYLFYASEVVAVPFSQLEGSFMIMVGAGFAGSAIMFLIVFVSKRFDKGAFWKNASTGVLLVFGPFAALVALVHHIGIEVPVPIAVISWVASGMGLASALMGIGFLLSRQSGENVCFMLAFSTIISCILYLLVINLTSYVAIAVVFALPLMIFFVNRLARNEQAEQPDSSEEPRTVVRDKALRFELRRFTIQLFFYCTVFAMVLVISLSTDMAFDGLRYIWVAIFISGILLMVYSTVLNKYIDLQAMQLALLPIIAVGLIPIALNFIGPETRYLFCLLIVFGFTSYDMLSLYQLSGLIRSNNLSIRKYFAFGRLADAAGVCFGWLLGYLIVGVIEVESSPLAMAIIPTTLIVALVIIVTLFPRKLSFEEQDTQEGRWKQASRELAAEYSLSPRESEVFFLLAKGRDAKYICEELFISNHTARSHIYHIYKKLDLHSQQEIISLVESRIAQAKVKSIKKELWE